MSPPAGSADCSLTDLHRKAQRKPNGDFGRIKHANTHKEQEQTGRNVQRKLVCTAKRASGAGPGGAEGGQYTGFTKKQEEGSVGRGRGRGGDDPGAVFTR